MWAGENPFYQFAFNNAKHYNCNKYWKMRSEVINPKSKYPKIIRLYFLWRVTRMDGFANAKMGTNWGYGAEFASIPHLPHGLNGITISDTAKIGMNCRIYQHVTIGESHEGVPDVPAIGDNCLIGAGAVLLGRIKIGNNVKIGANAVVLNDVPDNCTAVGIPARIIQN